MVVVGALFVMEEKSGAGLVYQLKANLIIKLMAGEAATAETIFSGGSVYVKILLHCMVIR